MIFPLGHDTMTVRRLPWVSIVIVTICVLAYGLSTLSQVSEADVITARMAAMEYFSLHPGLQAPPGFEQGLSSGLSPSNRGVMSEMRESTRDNAPPTEAELAVQQAEFDRLNAVVRDADAQLPVHRWGLIPAHVTVAAVLSHIFMHAGLMHLLGNLFMFYLCGPFIEDLWGRVIFPFFYLLAGSFAGLMFCFQYPRSEVPLVGASGAIAGVMGAFMIRHWKVKIRFAYWFTLRMRGTFQAYAWIMLPLWFIGELFNAWAYGSVMGGQGGIAYWSHVWGFVFGIFFALAVKYLQVEERLVNPYLEKEMGGKTFDPVIEQASAAHEEGKVNAALAMLRDALRRNPGDNAVAVSYWDMASASGKGVEAAPVLARVLRDDVKRQDVESALYNYGQLRSGAPDFRLDAPTCVKLAEILVKDHPLEATEVIAEAVKQMDSATPIGVTVRLVRIAHQAGSPLTPEIARRVLASPELPPAVREELAGMAGSGGVVDK